MTKIYLTSPIGDPEKSKIDWKFKLKEKYPDYEYKDPVIHEYNYVTGRILSQKELVEEQKNDIKESDFVICYMWQLSPKPCMELMYANSIGKKTIVVGEPGTVYDEATPWMHHHVDYFTYSFTNCFDWIDQQCDGQTLTW